MNARSPQGGPLRFNQCGDPSLRASRDADLGRQTIRLSRLKKVELPIMRIWNISPKKLCRNHLLGEHRELHAIWSVLVNGKKGYARHPGREPELFMAVRCEIAQTRREAGKHSSEGRKRTHWSTLTD